MVSKKVNKICVAYENLEKYFPKSKIVLTGNPVRSNINNFSDLFDLGIKSFDLNAALSNCL